MRQNRPIKTGPAIKARADRVEMENAERRKNLIPAKEIQSRFQAFAAAIERKIRHSKLGPDLQRELGEDLADFASKISVNGKNGGRG